MNLMDRMLIENEMENEDLNSLSHSLRSNIKINYNIKSLMQSEFIYDIDPDINDASLTDEQFLYKHRLRAEAKLIKTKLIYKLSTN